MKEEKDCKSIDFHNLSIFDGLLLLRRLSCHDQGYKRKPLMRNNRLYELGVYSAKNILLFRFRDSLNPLPGKLSALVARSLCPDLGTKGSIQDENVTLSNLCFMKKSLLDYMIQDIRLLGGIMQKAQEIYWELYQVDIDSKITLASLALTNHLSYEILR